MTTNDVEKRWRDPAALRAASVYVVSTIALAGLAYVLFAILGPEVSLWALGTPIVLALGGIGAFIKTYRIWRTNGTWPIWHGAGWFLLTLMLVSLSIPAMAITS